jgi:hypothetical protein
VTNNKNAPLYQDEKHKTVDQNPDQFFVGFKAYVLIFVLFKITQTKIFKHRLFY